MTMTLLAAMRNLHFQFNLHIQYSKNKPIESEVLYRSCTVETVYHFNLWLQLPSMFSGVLQCQILKFLNKSLLALSWNGSAQSVGNTTLKYVLYIYFSYSVFIIFFTHYYILLPKVFCINLATFGLHAYSLYELVMCTYYVLLPTNVSRKYYTPFYRLYVFNRLYVL